MKNRKILALIPARGGSKGIPRKNLLNLLGKPLISYSIGHAQKSSHVGRVVVSTDDLEIADVALKNGAEVPFIRPAEYAQDLSPDIDVFRHALAWMDSNEGYHPDLVVHLRPTGPVRKVELVDRAIEMMITHPEADSLRSIGLPTESPFKMWRLEGDWLRPLLKVDGLADCQSSPRQILPRVFWQTGYVDIVRPKTVLEGNSMTGEKVLPFIVDEPAHEIDYPDEIPRVEKALRMLEEGLQLDKQAVSMNRHSH